MSAIYQVKLLPVFALIFTACSSIVGSKITKEDLIVVQDLGVQLASYNIKGKLVSERFIDISRVRDFVINEVGRPIITIATRKLTDSSLFVFSP